MRSIFAVAAVTFALALPMTSHSAFAANTGQDKMKDCAAQWKAMSDTDKKGMKDTDFTAKCMKTNAATAAPAQTCPAVPITQGMTPQNQIKTCAKAWNDGKALAKNCTHADFSKLCLKAS